MAFIQSTGAYIPYYRLKKEEIVKAWGSGAPSGEKAIANFDEDSLTMAVEAGMDCLHGINPEKITGLYFACTTSPYKEKQSAAFIANALDLNRQINTIDFSGSLRAGTTALKAAADAVAAGTDQSILVIASDCRMGAPGTPFEQVVGDGAAALLVASDGCAELTDRYDHAEEILDIWRTHEDRYLKTWEDRFVYTRGFTNNMHEALGAFLKQIKLGADAFAKVVINAPDQRRHMEMVKALKLEKDRIQDPLFNTVGNTGTAHPLLMLVGALEEAEKEDKILLTNYGDGCDLFAFTVRNALTANENRRGVKGFLNSNQMIDNYPKYIQMKKLMQVDTGRRRPPAVSSAAVLHRDRNMVLAMHAGKCKGCGRLFFPPQRVCLYCRTKDEFETVRIANAKGSLFTFSKDFLAQTVDPPIITSVVHLDVEEGLRVFCTMADRNPDEVEIGMKVEMTFKKISEAEGFYNYFWKCRPIR